MSARCRFPPPWTVEDIGGCFVVKASNDQPLVFSLARLLTHSAARWIAAGMAKLPSLLSKGSSDQWSL
jgi:hypothetical protein